MASFDGCPEVFHALQVLRVGADAQIDPRHHRRGYWLRPAHTCGLLWAYAKCPVMLPPAKKAVMRFILAGSLLVGLNGRSVDLIARNGDARSRAGRPPSSDLAMVDAGAHRRMWRCELEVGGHRRRPGAIVGNGDAAARRARPGRLGIVGCGDARARRKKTASGCPRRQVCMRFREEETAPAIREENRAA